MSDSKIPEQHFSLLSGIILGFLSWGGGNLYGSLFLGGGGGGGGGGLPLRDFGLCRWSGPESPLTGRAFISEFNCGVAGADLDFL